MDLLESIGVFKTGDVKIRVASFICDEETCLFFGIFVFFMESVTGNITPRVNLSLCSDVKNNHALYFHVQK